MGQGVRTGLMLIVADELEADWSKLRITQAPGDEEKYGNQDTDGSRTTRHHFLAMRRIGAAARMMLESAAAAQWGVPVAEVKASNHEVLHLKSGRKIGYGALAEAASSLTIPVDIKLKDPSDFRYVGKGKLTLSTVSTSPPAVRSTGSTYGSMECFTRWSPDPPSMQGRSNPTTPPKR
jgi:isoquinoline 1-oxidoreductase beta subunit